MWASWRPSSSPPLTSIRRGSTSERRTQVVYGKLEELTALEKECDQKVAAVVARLRELLKAIGQDDSLAKEVEATYEEEKSLKKAYYLKEFQGG